MKNMHGKVAVVTGAGSGIGRALSAALAREGCDVALVDLHDEPLASAAELVREAGRTASTHVVDVADRARMAALPDAVLSAHGRVDIVVNNAGVSVAADFAEQELDDFAWLVGINLWGVVHGCKFFLPHLLRSDDAYIVNMSSMFGLVGVPGQSSYCATKFAVRGFSEAIAAELATTPVRVLCVHPGGIRTNIVRTARWGAGHAARREGIVRFFDQRTMPAEDAAARIVAAMRAGKSRLLITREAHLTDAIKRIFPVLPPRLLDRAQKLVRRARL
jgi:NAD(P)-dependent dehydrogenase (short-subunit alcohol dehydrogenase family)